MEETITVDGKQFILTADTPLTTEQKEQAIAEIRKQSGCGCSGKVANVAGIETMTKTCTKTSAFVGETITLKATGSGGTPPYLIVFTKGATELVRFTGVPENTEKSTTYVVQSIDVPSVSLNVTITDSCPGGFKSCMETCNLTVAECPTLVCSFTIT
jgi:hypothetical protein